MMDGEHAEEFPAVDEAVQGIIESMMTTARNFLELQAKALVLAGADPEHAIELIQGAVDEKESNALAIDPTMLLVASIRKGAEEARRV